MIIQVFITYGDKDNDDLLMLYGFILQVILRCAICHAAICATAPSSRRAPLGMVLHQPPRPRPGSFPQDNPHDIYSLTGLSEWLVTSCEHTRTSDPLGRIKRLEDRGMRAALETGFVSRQDGFAPALLHALRVFVATPTELSASADHDYAACISPDNEAAVLDVLKQYCVYLLASKIQKPSSDDPVRGGCSCIACCTSRTKRSGGWWVPVPNRVLPTLLAHMLANIWHALKFKVEDMIVKFRWGHVLKRATVWFVHRPEIADTFPQAHCVTLFPQAACLPLNMTNKANA